MFISYRFLAFYCTTLCVSAVLDVERVCLSVCVSVTLVYRIKTAPVISFLRPDSPIILVFEPNRRYRIPMETPQIYGL